VLPYYYNSFPHFPQEISSGSFPLFHEKAKYPAAGLRLAVAYAKIQDKAILKIHK